MGEKKRSRSFGTHDGTFHADEVTACALLLLFNLIDKDKIIRTRDKSLLNCCEFVCDVGGVYDPAAKLFDHHQVEYQGALSSAGMVLLYLRDEGVLDEKRYQYLNQMLIIGVDAHDNGKMPSIPGYLTYSDLIANFLPIRYDPPTEEFEESFHLALKFAIDQLNIMLERYAYTQSCREIVENAMSHHSVCLMFEQGIPWIDLFFQLGGAHHPAKFVIMPSGGSWNLRCIPPSYEEKMKVRHPLPAEWAGLLEGELSEVCGIPGAIFCHKGRFISVWETREDAMRALDKVLEKNGS